MTSLAGMDTEKGIFLRRLNRFSVACDVGGSPVEAHLPNPGRLWELLLPGRELILLRKIGVGGGMGFTVLAAIRDGRPVLLHTQMTNDVAAKLISEGQIPGLETARIVRREVTIGKSRFDFLLRRGSEEIILEVKSCTLFGKSLAMFPDAVTARGRRHLEELARLAENGITAGVIWLVHTPLVRYFLPDYHTDLDFARSFLAGRETLFYRAISLSWNDDLSLGANPKELEIPWDILTRQVEDRGCYILILYLSCDQKIGIGSLGPVDFRQGYYLYAGSARKGLSQRLARHSRKRKRFFWHVDYLRDKASFCKALPIRTKDDWEHSLACALAEIGDWSIPHFGSSDCSCPSHLVGMAENPLNSPRFTELLQYFRLDLPFENRACP